MCLALQKKREAGASLWCWRPLREKDIVKDFQWGVRDGRFTDDYYTAKEWECRPYERLIPLHALQKVQKIEKTFGDRVVFFVSDYVSPDVDPFIMVRPKMCDSGTGAEYHLIFDAWDEPGFGTNR